LSTREAPVRPSCGSRAGAAHLARFAPQKSLTPHAPDALAQQLDFHGHLGGDMLLPPALLVDQVFLPDFERLSGSGQEGIAPLGENGGGETILAARGLRIGALEAAPERRSLCAWQSERSLPPRPVPSLAPVALRVAEAGPETETRMLDRPHCLYRKSVSNEIELREGVIRQCNRLGHMASQLFEICLKSANRLKCSGANSVPWTTFRPASMHRRAFPRDQLSH
jgi:hypothetical protein